MPTLPPESFRLWVCPEAHDKEEAYGETPPRRERCRKCGKEYVSACPQCGKPYTAPDFETDYHDCGARIPWAEARERSVAGQRQLTLERLAAKKRGDPPWTEEERQVALQKRRQPPERESVEERTPRKIRWREVAGGTTWGQPEAGEVVRVGSALPWWKRAASAVLSRGWWLLWEVLAGVLIVGVITFLFLYFGIDLTP